MNQSSNEIKVFLASSSEMELERSHIGDLFNDINSLLIDTDVRIRLLKWEVFDPAFKGERKQSEYDQQVKKADIFIVLFRSKAGMFTMEEVDAAILLHTQKQKPEELYCFIQDYEGNREFNVDELKTRFGKYFVIYTFSDIKILKFRIIKILLPRINAYGIHTIETDKFIKINSENIIRKLE